jgi:drug/metabolite transporter (DMT)-like permease
MSRGAIGVSAALATVILWASAFSFIGIALREFEPLPLAALRFAVAASVMAVWFAATRPRLNFSRDGVRFFLCAAIGIAAYNALLNTGQRTVPAGAASFIVNTAPVISAALGVLFLGERFGRAAWIGSLASIIGVGLIASGQPGGLNAGASGLLIFGAATCQAVFFTLQRRLVAMYGAATCAAAVVALGALCLTPWLPAAISQARSASSAALFCVAYLGVFPAAAGYATWALAQDRLGSAKASSFLYLVPPVATALAVFVAGELPALATIVGGAGAIIGVIVVNWARRT